MKRSAILALLQLGIVLGLCNQAFAQTPFMPSASSIDQRVTTALSSLYAHNDNARELGVKAREILVFPDIKKAAFRKITVAFGVR
jgi:hypothetical protein